MNTSGVIEKVKGVVEEVVIRIDEVEFSRGGSFNLAAKDNIAHVER